MCYLAVWLGLGGGAMGSPGGGVSRGVTGQKSVWGDQPRCVFGCRVGAVRTIPPRVTDGVDGRSSLSEENKP